MTQISNLMFQGQSFLGVLADYDLCMMCQCQTSILLPFLWQALTQSKFSIFFKIGSVQKIY